MTLVGKNAHRLSGRDKGNARTVISGAAMSSIDQRMTLSRNRILEGSVRDDWRAVGRDIASALAATKREFEAA